MLTDKIPNVIFADNKNFYNIADKIINIHVINFGETFCSNVVKWTENEEEK